MCVRMLVFRGVRVTVDVFVCTMGVRVTVKMFVLVGVNQRSMTMGMRMHMTVFMGVL